MIVVLGTCAAERTALAAALATRLQQDGVAATVSADLLAIEAAPAARQREAVILLLGIDPAPGRAADGAAQAQDARLRAWLLRAGRPFSVIHGSAAERLENALRTVRAALPGAGAMQQGNRPSEPAGRSRPWAWSCEKCSDPDCEHQLFTRLVAARGGAVR